MIPSIHAVTVLSFIPLLMLPASADPITQGPTLPAVVARQDTGNFSSCSTFYGIVTSCSAATSNFFNLPFSVGASCLCYSSSIWQPTIYDNALSTCLGYLSTADPAYYSSLASNGVQSVPCEAVGDVATMTNPAGRFDPNSIACSSWYSMEASCSSK